VSFSDSRILFSYDVTHSDDSQGGKIFLEILVDELGKTGIFKSEVMEFTFKPPERLITPVFRNISWQE
jgi:hypothetical protein